MGDNKYNNTSKHWHGTSMPHAPSTGKAHIRWDHVRGIQRDPPRPIHQMKDLLNLRTRYSAMLTYSHHSLNENVLVVTLVSAHTGASGRERRPQVAISGRWSAASGCARLARALGDTTRKGRGARATGRSRDSWWVGRAGTVFEKRLIPSDGRCTRLRTPPAWPDSVTAPPWRPVEGKRGGKVGERIPKPSLGL